MFIAIVDFEVAAERRAEALALLAEDGAAARRMAGNLGFHAFADSESQTHVGLIHEWQSQADFDVYVASDAFARAGAGLRPMMTAPPVSRRYEARLYETVA